MLKKPLDLTLTESLAMWPTASVSGLYFAHPQSSYFQLGRIDKDQVEEYAKARDESMDENEIWLSASARLLETSKQNAFR